jgi:hypothetical protein
LESVWENLRKNNLQKQYKVILSFGIKIAYANLYISTYHDKQAANKLFTQTGCHSIASNSLTSAYASR